MSKTSESLDELGASMVSTVAGVVKRLRHRETWILLFSAGYQMIEGFNTPEEGTIAAIMGVFMAANAFLKNKGSNGGVGVDD